jgi:hypothetical protein
MLASAFTQYSQAFSYATIRRAPLSLAAYAAPLNGKSVETIVTDEVLAVLKPIWTAIETAYGCAISEEARRKGSAQQGSCFRGRSRSIPRAPKTRGSSTLTD